LDYIKQIRRITRWRIVVEAESMPPKVNSWRDTGNTPGRKNHQEEAKLCDLHTLSQHIASPSHVKQKNQEGSRSTRHQLLISLGDHQLTV
jgi:hypothetical protein